MLLGELNDRPIRVTFDNGGLEIMRPMLPHERRRKHIGVMIELMVIELYIELLPLGSTTFKREDLEKVRRCEAFLTFFGCLDIAIPASRIPTRSSRGLAEGRIGRRDVPDRG
jgi:hypothetical protein